jgi:hypothetical protein
MAPAPVAQLDRAFVFGTKGWEFEPLQVHHFLCSFEYSLIKTPPL